jgi:hypothetical protein
VRCGPPNGYVLGKEGPQIEKARSFILFAFFLKDYAFMIFTLNTVNFSSVDLRNLTVIFDILFLWLPVSEFPKLRERFIQKCLVLPSLQV